MIQNPHNLFLFFIVLGIAILTGLAVRRRRKLMFRFIGKTLISRMIPSLSLTRRFWKQVMIILVLVLMVVALLRPQYGVQSQTVVRKGLDIYVAFDTSLSMLAQDVRPSRIGRAKQEVISLLAKLNGDRLGLIGFSGTASVICPLTLDYGSVRLLLDDVRVGMIPRAGTDLDVAIRKGVKSFSKGNQSHKALIIMTDGESLEGDTIRAAQFAKSRGVHIYPVGLGTSSGEPIPIRDKDGRLAGYKKNEKKAVVLSKLQESVLRQVAKETGGRYFSANDSQLVVENLYKVLSSQEKGGMKDELLKQYPERYQHFLFFAFLLLLIEFCLSERRQVSSEWAGRVESENEDDR